MSPILRTLLVATFAATTSFALAPPAAADTCVSAPLGLVEACAPDCLDPSCASIPWCSGWDCLPTSSHGACVQGSPVLVGEQCVLDVGFAPCPNGEGSVVYVNRGHVGCLPL